MKKLISILMAAGMLFASAAAVSAAYTDIAADYDCYEPVMRLSELGVVSGYDDSAFRPWNTLTRAEFCKMVVTMLNKESEAKSRSLNSNFYDVDKNAWYLPYVNYMSDNSLVAGYADGSFAPGSSITYAEALTVICRTLGYSEEDVGYYWPNNYMKQGEVLGLTDGISGLSASIPMTRAAAAIIIDRALFTDINKKEDFTLLENIGYTVSEDTFILASKAEDISLTSKQIRTSEGVFDVKNSDIFNEVGSRGTLVLNSLKEAVLFDADELTSASAVISKLSSVNENTVEYKLADSTKLSFKFDNTFVTYVDNSKSTYAQAKNRISVGTDITFYGESFGDWEFAVIGDSADTVVPVRATKSYTAADTLLEGTAINFDGLKVYRSGEEASVSDIEVNDVIYYNTKTNIMDVYTKKVTGVYNEALPDKTYVTSVNVGGKVYTINSSVDTSSLDASSGSFKIGDKITLLLGKNDEVAFAVELSGFDKSNYGIVLKTYKDIAESGVNEGSSRYMASIFMPDGSTYEYQTDRYCDEYIGDLVYIDYQSNGIVSLKKQSTARVYGEVNVSKRTIGGRNFLKDAVIINRLSDEDADTAEVELLSFETLDITSIAEKNVIASITANSFGDIAIMYVYDMPSSYKYGYLAGVQNTSNDDASVSSAVYTIYSDGTSTKYSSESVYSLSAGAVYYKLSGGKISYIANMSLISSGNPSAVEQGRIMVNNKIYTLDDKVSIIDISTLSSLKTLSIDELKALKSCTVKLYSDKNSGTDSVIRCIAVTH